VFLISCTRIDQLHEIQFENAHCNNVNTFNDNKNALIDDPKMTGIEIVRGRVFTKKHSYYKLVFFTGYKPYMTKFQYDCKTLCNGDVEVYIWFFKSALALTDTLAIRCYVALRDDHYDMCYDNRYRCFDTAAYCYYRDELKKKGVMFNFDENVFQCHRIIFSGNYVKMLTDDECKVFLSKNKETISLSGV
jgi:hypothetical protein